MFRGVPLLARSGESFQSRVAQSILHYAGLTDMWANSWDDFIEKGVSFYRTLNKADSMDLKTKLLDRERDRHPYNIQWTTSQIEKTYKQILS